MEFKEAKAQEKSFGVLGEGMSKIAADTPAGKICEFIEDFLDDFLSKQCSGKQFDVKAGNCEVRCQPVQEPRLKPCIHLRWGDGPNDHLETDDTEILCVTVCNPYSNVSMKDFNLQILVLNADGSAVANQPNGDPSVQIKPQFNVCFGDIPSCDPHDEKGRSCISREVVMINRGAIEGPYQVVFFYCFEACFTQFAGDIVKLELVSS